MKKIDKLLKVTFYVTVVTVTVVVFAVSCDKLDVVGTESVNSFDKVLRQIPQLVAPDEMNGGWSLAAPDTSVRFIWSSDYAKSPLHDVMLELDAAPFIAAGLDPQKLPENYVFYAEDPAMPPGGTAMPGTAMSPEDAAVPRYKLMVGAKLGEQSLTYAGDVTPLTSYEQIVKHKR
ncbi:MAG: hypothetical protein LBD20_01930, partial [Spirochaetaceae bacterium]|nr:hypothetical protein [Spirochaetaceae bacterium]